jgi:toxin secretion/phage lysis holin
VNQTYLNVSAGVAGAFVAYAFGEWSGLLSFFLLAIAIDIFTGIGASITEGSGIKSATMAAGLWKKALMFVAIILAHHMDVLMDTAFIMDGAIYFYLVNELVSIVENYGRCGLPLPDVIRRVISVLRERSSSNDSQTKG